MFKKWNLYISIEISRAIIIIIIIIVVIIILAPCKMGTGSFPGVKCDRGVLLTTHPLSSAAVMEEYSYTSTHPLGHTGPVTGSL